MLAKAFSGELVQQDSRDEPASQLLDCIRTTPVAQDASEDPCVHTMLVCHAVRRKQKF